MPPDSQDEKPATRVGRTHRGEVSPPITTPAAVAAVQASRAERAAKPGAVAIEVYFVARGIENPILQASMRAYTDIRTATVEDFDEIFSPHHEVPAPKPAEETQKP